MHRYKHAFEDICCLNICFMSNHMLYMILWLPWYAGCHVWVATLFRCMIGCSHVRSKVLPRKDAIYMIPRPLPKLGGDSPLVSTPNQNQSHQLKIQVTSTLEKLIGLVSLHYSSNPNPFSLKTQSRSFLCYSSSSSPPLASFALSPWNFLIRCSTLQ